MLLIEIVSGSQAGSSSQAKKFPFCIGRSPTSDLQLSDAGIWDQHAEIRMENPPGLSVTLFPNALGSLNGQAFSAQRICNGDLLQLGSAGLRLGLSPVVLSGYRMREIVVWAGLILLCAFQIWLIYFLL